MDDPNLGTGRGSLALFMGVFGGLAVYLAGTEILQRMTNPSFLYLSALIQQDWQTPSGHQALPILAGSIVAVAVAIWTYRTGYINPERHLRGRRLTQNIKDVQKSCPRKPKPDGIFVHPGLPITQSVECKHLMLLGGSGSGKTSILRPMVDQAIQRGDKVFVLSFKNDFQENLDVPFSLLAPWDVRTSHWRLGQDVQTFSDARGLSETLIPIPPNDNPLWAKGARELLTAIIHHLQQKHGTNWGYTEMAALCTSCLVDPSLLHQIAGESNAISDVFLRSKSGDTTMGFLVDMAGAISGVIDLGVAVQSLPDASAWSVRGFLQGTSPKVVILGFRASLRGLSQMFAASVIEQLVRQLLDLPDCLPSERRVWLFLDEVGQFEKIPSITMALETLRSKGVRVVLGLQSTSQIEKEYSQSDLNIWTGQCNTKIICQLQETHDQKWASDLVGDRELERYHHQWSTSSGNGASTKSRNWQRLTEKVLMPAEFGQRLSANHPQPIHALWLTGQYAAILSWNYPKLSKLRPAVIPAAWTQPGYTRPLWGVIPSREALSKSMHKEQQQGQVEQESIPVVTVDSPLVTVLPESPVPSAIDTDLLGDILDAVHLLHGHPGIER